MKLPQDQSILDGPIIDHMDGGFARSRIVGTPKGFAIERDDLPFVGQFRGQRLNPRGETILEVLGRDPGEDTAEGVMRRNAVGQLQYGF